MILGSFENISLKYEDIKDLYKIHFDSNIKKREYIITLYKKSIFNIYLIFQNIIVFLIMEELKMQVLMIF